MRYLKRFNESVDLESQLRDFSETYLAYLLDDGYKVQVSATNLKTQFMIKLYKITEINEEEYESNEFTWLDVKDSYIPFLHMLNREYDIIDDVVEFYVSVSPSTTTNGGDDELVEVDVEKVLSGDVLPHGRDNESILDILVWINFDKPIKESVELQKDDIEHYLVELLDSGFDDVRVTKSPYNNEPSTAVSIQRKLTYDEWQSILKTGITYESVIIGVRNEPMKVFTSSQFKKPVPLSIFKSDILNQVEFFAQDAADKLLLSLSDKFVSKKIVMSFKAGPGHLQQYNFGDISIRLQIILTEKEDTK
jgi:hypothetical protein